MYSLILDTYIMTMFAQDIRNSIHDEIVTRRNADTCHQNVVGSCAMDDHGK
jgi:hypothetical protein